MLILLLGCIMATQNVDFGFTSIVGKVTAEYPRHSEGDIIELKDGTLLLGWTRFTGGGADNAAAHIAAMTSKDGGRTWSEPYVIQENTGKQNVMSLSFIRLRSGKIGMFYLEKNSNSDLQVHYRYSTDGAKTWGPIRKVDTLDLPEPPPPAPSLQGRGNAASPPPLEGGGRGRGFGEVSPGYNIMNNDRVVQLKSGRIVLPICYSPDMGKPDPLVVFCMYSDDEGKTWKRSTPDLKCPKRGAMEPGVVELANGDLLMVIRNQMGCIYTSASKDRGATWSDPVATDIKSPESPATIKRIPKTKDLLLVWNNNETGSRQRSPLTAAISKDSGKTWINVRKIEHDPASNYAYISIDFVKDNVLLTYYDEQSAGWNLRFRSVPLERFTER